MTSHENSFNHSHFPYEGTLREQVFFVLQLVSKTPSTHNSQPWKFFYEDEEIRVIEDSSIQIYYSDLDKRDKHISFGFLVGAFEIVSDFFCMDMSYEFKSLDPIEIRFKINKSRHEFSANNLSDRSLINAIQNRYTYRGIFTNKAVNTKLLNKIKELVWVPGIDIDFSVDEKTIKEYSKLTQKGVIQAYQKKEFRDEISYWFRNPLSKIKDGLHTKTLGLKFPMTYLLPFLMKNLNISKVVAKNNAATIESAAGMCVISGDDSFTSRIDAGRVAYKTILHMCANQIYSSIYVASIEIGDLYKELCEFINTDGRPLFAFSFGYVKEHSKYTSPKKDLTELYVQNRN